MPAAGETVAAPPPLYRQDGGVLEYNLHSGQERALMSQARTILVSAGAQSGKTSFGPLWLAQEIARRGPGDYLVVAPTFQLLSLKAFPEFVRLFKTTLKWGDFTGRSAFTGRFLFNAYGCRCLFDTVPDEPTQVFFRHAQDPEGVESATAKGVWVDEGGQKKFRLGTWEAIMRRAAINRARILITTTPYTLGWMYELLYKPWKKCKDRLCGCPNRDEPRHKHPTVEVVNFRSTENPTFPREEYEDRKKDMPGWKFRMFYDGLFERPAGVIYEDFNTDVHVVRPFVIPGDWPTYLGLDFGGLHTAGTFLAGEVAPPDDPLNQVVGVRQETGRLFGYREYPKAGKWKSAPAEVRVKELLTGEPRIPRAVGGSKSEDNWRDEFRLAKVRGEDGEVIYPGLFVAEPPIKDVEVGIDRVIKTIRGGQLYVFEDCTGLVGDLTDYSRELDDLGNPTEKIEDKEDYHYADALRYIIAYVKGAKQELWYRQGDAERSPERPEAAQGLPLPFADHERPRWNPGR